jgi:Mrp family chromosome partitioning ATPase
MSRNFELLTQFEIELGGTDHRAPIAADHAVVKELASTDNCAEEIARLVQSLFLSADGSAPRQVVFCGVDAENGSSSVCARAGRTLANNSSLSVCLVDANVGSPRLSGILGFDRTTPFSHRSTPVHEQCVQITSNLWLAGADVLADARGLLAPADRVRHVLAQLREVFDYLLIDAPGTSIRGDAAILGQVTGAAVLVIEANRTRRQTARKAKETLDAAGVRVLGTVLRDRSFPIPEELYKRL